MLRDKRCSIKLLTSSLDPFIDAIIKGSVRPTRESSCCRGVVALAPAPSKNLATSLPFVPFCNAYTRGVLPFSSGQSIMLEMSGIDDMRGINNSHASRDGLS